jgi:hypothetical protein
MEVQLDDENQKRIYSDALEYGMWLSTTQPASSLQSHGLVALKAIEMRSPVA